MEYPKFKVCVRCFTFNQSKFITDALNGFTMQQTDFPFVCCIVDDASTDGEQEVIRKYVEENFDLSEGSCHFERETDYAFITYAQHKMNRNCYFAVLYLKENHYSIKKPKMPYLSEWRDMCEYEALCEGDDYWIDANKLKIQVDVLDADNRIALCYTQAKGFSVRKDKFLGEKSHPFSGFTDLLFENVIPTLTVMIRRTIYNNYQQEIQPQNKGWKMGDYPLWLYCAERYNIHYLPICSAIYRYTDGSASHPLDVDKRIEFDASTRDIRLFFAAQSGSSDDVIKKINHNYSCAVLNTCLNMNAPYKAYKLLYGLPNLAMKEKMMFMFRIVKRFCVPMQ